MSTDETTPDAHGFWARNWLLAVLAVLMVGAIVAVTLQARSDGAVIDEQETRMAQIRSEIRTAQLEREEEVEADVLATLGLSTSRLAQDAPIIDRFVDTAFTWTSGVDYELARTDLQEQFGLSASDPFLTEFMPPSSYNEDASGERYYTIDVLGMNSSAGSMDISVVRAVADEYSYVVVAQMDLTSDDVLAGTNGTASSTAHRQVLLEMTLTGDGEITSVTGIPAEGEARSSG